MKSKKTKVKYEIFNYEGPGSGIGFKAYTLTFKNPASVSFFNYGAPAVPAFINNNIILEPFSDVNSGIATRDYKYTFINNVNEVDDTIYIIKCFTGVIVQVVVKFYVDEE